MRVVVRQFPRPRILEAELATDEALARRDLGTRVRGRRIAITAGSRGICGIASVLRGAAGYLRRLGAKPVIVAAMGSRGRGTAEGQRRVLEHLGITEEFVDAPISTCMEAVVVGRTSGRLAAYCDAVAASCDGIMVVTRIKPRTAFSDPFGSRLTKMLTVGLGKIEGASQIHPQRPAHLSRVVRKIAQIHLSRGTVVAGLALMGNAYDETAIIDALLPETLVEREIELFEEARRLLPRLPVDELDVPVVDEMGKIYAGSGMDTNVIGRWRTPGLPEPSAPRIARILALRLSSRSEGNAQGIGLADVVTERLAKAMDRRVTYLNTITSTFLGRGSIPMTMMSDREAVANAIDTVGIGDPRRIRLIRIPNTLHLERLPVSETLVEEIRGLEGVETGEEVSWAF